MSVTKQFILAGDATFTIETPLKGHYTYRIQHVEKGDRWPEAYFIKLLTGSDNNSSYTYLGKLNDYAGRIELTSKSRMAVDSYPVRLLGRVLDRIWVDDHNSYESHGFKTHHEGKCGRCGRKLTTPISTELGIGPECAKIMGIV